MYPWGENPNIHFKMYWKDASNVLQDLSQFQALYIEVHGCVWSECAVDNFDDDGENHDGDNNWYQTRTHSFCANAAYSIFGIRKNNFRLVNACSKGTYINTFFTYGGADLLAKALGLSIKTDDGNRYSKTDDDQYGTTTSNKECVQVEGNGRHLDDADEDSEASSQSAALSLSTTMGCAASPTSKYNRFVLAGFSDAYCTGQNFLETLDVYKSYNHALHKVTCSRIWNLKGHTGRDYYGDADGDANENDDEDEGRALLIEEGDPQEHRHLSNDNNNNVKRVYNSIAEHLLYNSWACDLTLYPEDCPDPYGLKRKYLNVMKAAANGQPIQLAVWNSRIRKPVRIITWLLFAVGFYLLGFSYVIRNKSYIQSNGGGVVGFAYLVGRDVVAGAGALREQGQKIKEDLLKNRKSRRISGSNNNSSSANQDKSGGLWATLFGKKKRKKKRKSNRKLQRSQSGRSLEGDQFADEESVYTEMTDEYTSKRSRSKSRHSTRKSKAAETAFAAAAQFDLEQQHLAPNRHHHPSILPALSHGGSIQNSRSSGRSSRRSGRRHRSESPALSHAGRPQSARSLSQSARSLSTPRRAVDASPTRTPRGPTSQPRGSRRQFKSGRARSKSPQPRDIV